MGKLAQYGLKANEATSKSKRINPGVNLFFGDFRKLISFEKEFTFKKNLWERSD